MKKEFISISLIVSMICMLLIHDSEEQVPVEEDKSISREKKQNH